MPKISFLSIFFLIKAVNSVLASQMGVTRNIFSLRIFLIRMPRLFRTHVSRVAPDWDLLDTLMTELQHQGKFSLYDTGMVALVRIA